MISQLKFHPLCHVDEGRLHSKFKNSPAVINPLENRPRCFWAGSFVEISLGS